MMVSYLCLIHLLSYLVKFLSYIEKKHFSIKNDTIITTLQYLKDFTQYMFVFFEKLMFQK